MRLSVTPQGSQNSTSVGKTNFWEKGQFMYGPGASEADVGLEGKRMPGLSNQPQTFEWGGSQLLKWFEATGIRSHLQMIRETPTVIR